MGGVSRRSTRVLWYHTTLPGGSLRLDPSHPVRTSGFPAGGLFFLRLVRQTFTSGIAAMPSKTCDLDAGH